MSNKNISQSITEAWAKSVATGMVQSEKKEQKRQQLDETSATLHNKAVQHILENDKGFYRPDTDPFFRKVDGDLLRRQRLVEQEDPMPMEGGADGKESERVRKEVEKRMEEIKKREQEELARRDAQAQTGINPDSERYQGRENEAGLRGDPDFDPAAPGAAGEVRASQVKDDLNKVTNPYHSGRRLPAGYAGRGTNYGGAVAVGQMAPRELSPEERARQRAEQEERTRSGAEGRLKGLDQDRRDRIEAGLADDADLDTISMAITRERSAQRRAGELADSGYEAGRDFDPETGRLTDDGRAIRAGRQQAAQDKRDAVRARSKARSDQNKAENLARKQQRTARSNRRRADLGMKQLGMPKAAEYGLPGTIEGLLSRGIPKATADSIGSGVAPSGSGGSGTSTDGLGEKPAGVGTDGEIKNGYVFVPGAGWVPKSREDFYREQQDDRFE
tara:strand:- start:2329 stop:3666 length:1338 start_codon:yes stop_codon:yes gene_type:complete